MRRRTRRLLRPIIGLWRPHLLRRDRMTRRNPTGIRIGIGVIGILTLCTYSAQIGGTTISITRIVIEILVKTPFKTRVAHSFPHAKIVEIISRYSTDTSRTRAGITNSNPIGIVITPSFGNVFRIIRGNAGDHRHKSQSEQCSRSPYMHLNP